MGDGIQKKYALILNGDTEARHLLNVDRAVEALHAEDPAFEISVLSTAHPKNTVSNFEPSDASGLKKVAAGLASQLDDDDLLVVYVTGHGDQGAQAEGCVQVQGGQCLSLNVLREELATIQYGKRIVVMDQCYSGKGLPLFADSKTWVVTQGTPNERVSCELFSPFFWDKKIPDDGDGVLTLQERYVYALTRGKTPSMTQFFNPGLTIALSGKEDTSPPFTPDKVERVDQDSDFQSQLKKLKEGELALVMFSADYCEPCKAYEPKFEALAKKYQGRFLMIHAEEKTGQDPWLDKYGIRELPTVAFVDARGKITVVADREDPEASLIQASAYDKEEQLQILARQLNGGNLAERKRALRGLENMGEEAASMVPQLIVLLNDPNFEVAILAANALGEIGPQAQAALPTLRKLLETEFYFRLDSGQIMTDPELITFLREIKESQIKKAILHIEGNHEERIIPEVGAPSEDLTARLQEALEMARKKQGARARNKEIYVEAGGHIGSQNETVEYGAQWGGEYRWNDHWGLGFELDYGQTSAGQDRLGPQVGLVFHPLAKSEGGAWDPFIRLPALGFSYLFPTSEEERAAGALSLTMIGGGVRYFFNETIFAETEVRGRALLPANGDKGKLGVEAPLGLGVRY